MSAETAQLKTEEVVQALAPKEEEDIQALSPDEEIEPSVDEGGGFSDVGSSLASDTTSLNSEVLDYVYENGRRYHGYRDGKYLIPNDETEQDRLDMMHHVYLMLHGGELHLGPIKPDVQSILDLGTGTGIWAIDMAEKYPSAQVIGIDLSPIQPSWLPNNCSFQVDDLEEPWNWNRKFDFIHSRAMAVAIKDWPKYIGQIYTALAPGGTAEIFESGISINSDDNSIPPDSDIELLFTNFAEALRRTGVPDPCVQLEKWMNEAGFADVKLVRKKLPWGGWPKDKRKKDLGRWTLMTLETGLKAYALALFTRVLGIPTEEATRICEGAFKGFQSREVHVYSWQWIVTGTKREDASDTSDSSE